MLFYNTTACLYTPVIANSVMYDSLWGGAPMLSREGNIQ